MPTIGQALRLASLHPAPPGLLGRVDQGPAALPLPLLPIRVTCGFPSPAEDYFDTGDTLDLNTRCIQQPAATFFVEADTGLSMEGVGIFPGDTLIVDRSLTARHGSIVMALWEGGFIVKQLQVRNRRFELHSASPGFQPILVPEDVPLDVWGVVTWSLRQHGRR